MTSPPSTPKTNGSAIPAKSQRMIKLNTRTLIFTIIVAGIALILSSDRTVNPAKADSHALPLSYQVLVDHMDTVVVIGVPADITDGQLRATMSKAADAHQDDEARDYLITCCLTVRAVLVKGDRRSREPAGELHRYVPYTNPTERRKISSDRRRSDEISTYLEDARKTF